MVGLIGIGHIGEALLEGLLNSEKDNNKFLIYDLNVEVLNKYNHHEAVYVKSSNVEVVKGSEVIFLCVKPNQFEDLALEIKTHLTDDQLIVSVAQSPLIMLLILYNTCFLIEKLFV